MEQTEEMRRNLLITICILILSSMCLFAETSLGTIQFDYNIYKRSAGTVSSYYFEDPAGNRVTQIGIDMNIDNEFDAYRTPQVYFVQENNLKADDYNRRVKLSFSTFTPSDGNNAGFKGCYAVFVWKMNTPTDKSSGLYSSRDKAARVTGNGASLEWGLDNSNSQDGEPMACYYGISFLFSGTGSISGNYSSDTVDYLESYQVGEYSATITAEIFGN